MTTKLQHPRGSGGRNSDEGEVVIITPITRCFNTADKYNRDASSPSPAGCRANRALVETLDMDAMRAWLR